MKTEAYKRNVRKLVIMAAIMLLCVVLYLVWDVKFSNPKFLQFSMKIRTPKLLAMLIAAFAIGAASIVAKEARDRMMKEYDKLYPGYGFARNMGYGTAEHIAALNSAAITPTNSMTDRIAPRL